jgi:hypothetical protein
VSFQPSRIALDNTVTGGILGFGCSHAYAHSSDYANTHLPRALEGADLALYSVLQSLGIRLSILPVLDEITSYRAGSPGGCHRNGDHLRTDPDILNPVSLSITKCENTDQRWEELYKRRSDWCYDRASESDMVKVGTRRYAHAINTFNRFEETNQASGAAFYITLIIHHRRSMICGPLTMWLALPG